jgi:hypothetical protein
MAGQPTLRHGDHEKDGWVKYLQEQLNYRAETHPRTRRSPATS